MVQSRLPFPDVQITPSGEYGEPDIWLRRLILVDNPEPPIHIIRRIAFRRGLNIICTEQRLPEDTQPVGHSVGKSLLVRIVRYCLGEDRFCTESQRSGIAAQIENGYAFAVIRVKGQDWAVARPLGLRSGYGGSWCVQSSRLKDLLNQESRLKYRQFVDALDEATKECYADIDLPRAERKANWRDLLGWLSRDQDCYFKHHADWREAELQAGPRALTREDAYLVMRTSLGLLSLDEISLMENHRRLLARKKEAETLAEQYTAYTARAEEQLRSALEELRDLPPGELFGSAFVNIASKKIDSLEQLLADPDIFVQEDLSELQDSIAQSLRTEGALQNEVNTLTAKEQATQEELANAEQQDALTLLATLSGLRWKCRYYKSREDAENAGCPGETMTDQGIADPWRKQRIKDIQDELAAIRADTRRAQRDLEAVRRETTKYRRALSQHTAKVVRARGDISQKIGLWNARRDEAERYAAACRRLNALSSDRSAQEKEISDSTAALRAARSRFEAQKADLSAHYESVLKRIIAPNAEGTIEVDGDGIRPNSNAVVADSGTTVREYADVLSFDLACLAASTCGIGYLPRLWIHDSPRQADSEEQLYYSILRLIAEMEAKYNGGQRTAFQYILTTTSAPPPELNRSPYVRLRLHARTADGKLLRCDFGK